MPSSRVCGKEDVDWEAVPIANRGLGIRAKKLIPAGLKMIFEPIYSAQMVIQVNSYKNLFFVMSIHVLSSYIASLGIADLKPEGANCHLG